MIGMSACLRATRLWLSLATRRTRMNNRFWGVVVELRGAGLRAHAHPDRVWSSCRIHGT